MNGGLLLVVTIFIYLKYINRYTYRNACDTIKILNDDLIQKLENTVIKEIKNQKI